MKNTHIPICISIPQEIAHTLRVVAAYRNISRSQLIRGILEKRIIELRTEMENLQLIGVELDSLANPGIPPQNNR